MADNIGITLKVIEASNKDLGIRVDRIDYDSMDYLNASTSDNRTNW